MTALRSVLRHPEAVIAAVLFAAMVIIGLVNPAFWGLDNLFGCCAPTSSPASWRSAC